MIQMIGWVDEHDQITRLRIDGHADSGRYGEDVVCAAVSALVETLALGLKEFGVEGAHHRVLVDEGRAEFWIETVRDPDAERAARWIVAGLKDLARSHGRFVHWQEIRVKADP
jgi:uncharacterized protein YsxB (DUF464 family)